MVAKDRAAMFEMWSSINRETLRAGTPSKAVAYPCYILISACHDSTVQDTVTSKQRLDSHVHKI